MTDSPWLANKPTLQRMAQAMADVGTPKNPHQTICALIRAAFEGLEDDALIDAFWERGGKPGDALADMLLAEIERRQLGPRPRSGAQWTEEGDAALRALAAKEMDVLTIARLLGRTTEAVDIRARRLKVAITRPPSKRHRK